MCQRNISQVQLDYVLDWGKIYDRAGAMWYVLRGKDIPPEHRCDREITKMNGIVVCLEADTVSTVYRHDRPSHHVRQKSKENWRFSPNLDFTVYPEEDAA